MFKKLSITIILLSLFVASVPAQNNATEKADDKAKATQKAAIDFLRETATDVERLRSMENRISFSSELASLMWFHDEREAKGMYGQVVNDFKQLMMQFDGEMNLTATEDDDDGPGGFLFGGRGGNKVQRKFRIALAVRQQIAMSLAEHAPDLALNFFYDSIASVSNPGFRKQADQMDKYFESRLLIQIAESDAAKGVEYGRESIKRQINSMHIELLRNIYKKDAAKGIDFGQALLSAAKSDPKRVEGLGFYQSLIIFAEGNLDASKKQGGKSPVYSATDIRDIAEMLYQGMMAESKDMEQWERRQFIPIVEKHLPGRGAQLRAKFKDPSANSNTMRTSVRTVTGSTSAMAVNGPTSAVGTGSGIGDGGLMDPYERQQKEREEKAKAEAKMIEDMKKLGQSDLPKEERDKVIAQARKIIAETKGKDKKIVALGILATSVAKLGDKDLANEIMLDAERMVTANPKNYQDFMYTWLLAGGYAEANPDKAFPLLESTILKANGTLDAFVRVAEFIDVQEEIVSDGEVQVGAFGGEMIRGFTRELGAANTLIRTLANADFNRTKGLAGTFDRTEMRVLAKMLVLRAVLDKKTESKPDAEDLELLDVKK
ncbi:MAG: hypothetical protein JNL64_02775 [Blastocatellia bacterium]|nr:hypothetical protein [Blastocatellia bacterium]